MALEGLDTDETNHDVCLFLFLFLVVAGSCFCWF